MKYQGFYKCPLCGDLLLPSETQELYDDAPAHEECIPVTPETRMDPATLKLSRLLSKRGTLLRAVYLSDIWPGDLPERIQDALFRTMAYESTLFSLLEDVASEHYVEERS